MAIAEILGEINKAEDEADGILLRAGKQVAEIEKETAVKIDKINADTDTETAEIIKNMTPATVTAKKVTVSVTDEKINSAVAFGTKEFMARFGV
jgi:hypothetical protein